ncbi:MAG: sulfite exporter TauE/SafE family protein [Aerococcus sp.]|nr:sulfite exporter TauE/SafE family protein [Aerococcus sp.]
MFYYLLYFIVIIIAVFFGAMAGLGGGVIIKPVLDAIGHHPLFMINFFSSVAVFVMSITSITKQVKSGFKIQWKESLALAVGCILGGIISNQFFDYLLRLLPSEDGVKLIQIAITILILGVAVLYSTFSRASLHIKGGVPMFIMGGVLAFLSVLLGIGGGPINVAAFLFFFGMSMKQAAVYSIITIFFAQAAKLVTIAVTSGFGSFELTYLIPVILAAIMGSYLGSVVNTRITDQSVRRVYIVVTILIIGLNIYNGMMLLG